MTNEKPVNADAVADDSQSTASRTLTVGEIVDRLNQLDRSLPVVFEAEDEPLGSYYGVRDVGVVPMQRDSTFAAEPGGCDVYVDPHPDFRSDKYDEPGPVAFLSIRRVPAPGNRGAAAGETDWSTA